MSKFNQTNTVRTVNKDGYIAYAMSDREHLVTAVLASMFGEEKFYGKTDGEIVTLAKEMAKKDPEFVCKLAAYTRNEGNLRSVSHVLAAVIAREAHEYTRTVIRNVVVRPDDITEIMACYKAMYGTPFPNALKRQIADEMQKFDEYQFAKYNGGNKAIKFRDVLRITHPVPKDHATESLFGKILNDTLEIPYTWETELSAKGNTAEVWNALIASGKVGYMAMLRNLRNIVKSGADVKPVLARIADADQVRKSRQLPFRFYSAYRILENERLMTGEIHKALEKALTASIENIEQIRGRTLIAIDVSGSMGSQISRNSDIRCVDIAALMGAMAAHICEDATVCYFDCAGIWSSTKDGYRIARYGKYDSVLDICKKTRFTGGGTDMALPMEYALHRDTSAAVRPFDRVIYFSDNQCNSSQGKTIQSYADQYRARYNPDFWVHAVDLQGYGTQQFRGGRFNLIAGWNERVLEFIGLAEKGFGSLVSAIDQYELK